MHEADETDGTRIKYLQLIVRLWDIDAAACVTNAAPIYDKIIPLSISRFETIADRNIVLKKALDQRKKRKKAEQRNRVTQLSREQTIKTSKATDYRPILISSINSLQS